MPNTKYISVDRLSEFLTALKGKYSANALTGEYQVLYAHNADQATKDASGNVITSTYATQTALSNLDAVTIKTINFTPSGAAEATALTGNTVAIDLSQYALKSEISAIMNFKGVVAAKTDLPASGTAGDVYVVTANNCEVIWDGTKWEELGPTIDLSGYVTKKAAANGKIATFDATGDVIGTAVDASILSNGAVTSGNGSFVTGGQVATAIANLGNIVNDVKVGVSGSEASVVSNGEAVITLTDAVTENSTAPVTSGAVYGAIHALDYSKVVAADGTTKIDTLQEASASDITAMFA